MLCPMDHMDPVDRRLPVELEEDLSEWRDAAAEFLRAACGVSDRCVIVTNSKPPWAPRMGRGRRSMWGWSKA